MASIILHFNAHEISLLNSGGKALNLARLWKAGFNVPSGFIVSTCAYKAFVESNNLNELILDKLTGIDPGSTRQLEAASATIRSAFSNGRMSSRLQSKIVSAYSNLDREAVAVRSSATTEDLPDLSFAGQQDTFLNVIGERKLLEAVLDCWSSLWTARAIGYRARNDIPQADAAVAVIIQKMVESVVSGVLFTANPVNGLRSQSVIDATFGLGEALVSGQVDPDHFVVDHRMGKIISRSIGSKKISTRSLPDGGVQNITDPSVQRASLDDTQVMKLVQTGRKIHALFESPQDIEWAYANDSLYILQSRPITSLFPVPELSHDPLVAWMSFGSVQGLLGPITPLGQEGIKTVLTGAARLFGSYIEPQEQSIFVTAGERIWIRISDFVRNPIGNRLFDRLMQFVEPSVVAILSSLKEEPELGAGKGRLTFRTLRRAIGFFIPVLIQAIRNARHPEAARERFDREVEEFIASITIPTAMDRFELLAQSLKLMQTQIQSVFQFVLPRFVPLFAPGMASLVLLDKLSGGRNDLTLEITRSLSGNVTIEMDLALWEVAGEITEDKNTLEYFETLDARSIAERYLAGGLTGEAERAIDDFLDQYGMRGVGEIDIGQPRWSENPLSVFQTLQSYLRLPPERAPDVLFARGKRSAEETVDQLIRGVRDESFGWIKAKVVRAAARRVRALLGARETPKFLAIRTMGIIRTALLKSGGLFVQEGTIAAPDDLFYLYLHELDELSQGARRDWASLIAKRRQSYAREVRRKLVPRVLLSDGRTFYEGVGAATDTGQSIGGSPVSPGVVEGIVHIVLDPHDAQLEPGAILVCPGTDPAWTPLFLAAGGLITEVGGMMTHGSVVAREYGIPAVVGVHEATTRLKNGQKIRLDGSEGTITVLD